MNQRIKELALQADILITEVGAFHNTSQGAYQLQEQHMEKFAELIVRECMSICKKNEYYNVGGEDPETIGHIRAGAMFCREDIKEHFGVDE
jgi:hypothetical protein